MGFSKKQYKPGSANFESHYLRFTQDSVQVVPSRKLLVFFGIFTAVGLGIMSIPLYAESDSAGEILGALLFGVIFFGLGGGTIISTFRRSYPQIDLYQRIFYPVGRNRRRPADESPAIPLSEVEGIAISTRLVSGSKSSYRCYTLSLKFSGDREFILLNHGSRKAFMRDAELLSECLDLPLPEDDTDFEKKQRAANAKAAPVLLGFSLFWLVMCVPVHLQTWGEGDIFPRIFTGLFVAVGLIILFCAIKGFFAKKPDA